MRVIKKYNNRKLYDTESHKYVGLVELADLVSNSVEVMVIDNASKQDITRKTLLKTLTMATETQSKAIMERLKS